MDGKIYARRRQKSVIETTVHHDKVANFNGEFKLGLVVSCINSLHFCVRIRAIPYSRSDRFSSW